MESSARFIKGSLVVPLELIDKRLAKIIPLLGEPVGPWVKEAACRSNTELFFSALGPDWTTAKEICAECPVRRSCLAYALRTKQLHGTWGGMNQLELRWLLAMNALGRPKRYTQPLRCPWCHRTGVLLNPPEIRSGGPETCSCPSCGFKWERVYVAKRGRRKAA